MPFIAHDGAGDAVAPEQAKPGAEYTCPACGGSLGLRSSHQREGSFVSSHFWHDDGGSGCGGESDEHKRMKSIAMSKAKQKWPDATVSWEGAVAGRRADVLVCYDTPHPRLGGGLAIECQFKNTGKDVEAVTDDFIQAGVSVLWLGPEQFTERDVDFTDGRMVAVLESALPDADEWAGYHGVVRWLRQEKPATAEMEVPFPVEIVEVPPEQIITNRGYQHTIKLGENNNHDCSACGSPAVMYVRDPADPDAVAYPRGAYLCSDCAPTDGDVVQKVPCAECGEPHAVGDMYPYRARYQRLKRGEGHVFDEDGVEWYCFRCAGDLPPLSDLR